MKLYLTDFISGSMNNRLKQFVIIFCMFAATQATAQKKKDILMTIGGIPVTTEEFETNYKKNNTNVQDEKDKKTPTEYLNLYINFKLKVLEAERLGYDTVKAFRDELNGYRKELAKPYLTDVSYNDEMVRTEYHRTQYERKASHILLRVAPDAAPADTLAAWNKLEDIRKQILNGADFNEMAAKYSEDPSAVQNKGHLGYFSAFQMVYPFEDMTYRTPVGQVSDIVRSRFGYHLIKVEDERPASGEIKVAHIMKMFPRQASSETIANLKSKADSIWKLATSGADFAELAKKYSDDNQSAPNGGVMNWFSATNMVPEFAEAAFALKKDGDISPVIRTPYGWHIIKRLEWKPIPPFEKMKPDIESRIRKNPAIAKYSDEAFDRKLRAEYQLKTDETVLDKLSKTAADSVHIKNWNELAQPFNDASLVSFADQSFTVGSFADYLQEQKFAASKKYDEASLKTMLDYFIHEKLLAYEDTQLEKKYPDFARTFREYHDGILLFNISKDKIWDVASNDTARLENYFAHTDKKYFWNDRFRGWVIQAKTPEIRVQAETMLDKEDMDKQQLLDFFNAQNENNLQIRDVAVEKGNDPVVDYYIWSGPKPAQFDETTTFVHGKITHNELKDLKDAWGLYSSDFQEQVEKEWIASLRKKYPVVINKKVLKGIPATE